MGHPVYQNTMLWQNGPADWPTRVRKTTVPGSNLGVASVFGVSAAVKSKLWAGIRPTHNPKAGNTRQTT